MRFEDLFTLFVSGSGKPRCLPKGPEKAGLLFLDVCDCQIFGQQGK